MKWKEGVMILPALKIPTIRSVHFSFPLFSAHFSSLFKKDAPFILTVNRNTKLQANRVYSPSESPEH